MIIMITIKNVVSMPTGANSLNKIGFDGTAK